jgi:hypothetical protein
VGAARLQTCQLPATDKDREENKHTGGLEALLKPYQASRHHKDVDEAEVGDDWDDVDIQLLVELEVLHVEAVQRFNHKMAGAPVLFA